ncbi:hypothetical protein C0993_007590 [Termitomyces sp. T159_Od127]|nr:hypothetical protein C0993_007590 [Termitomyces sp. T159_Od127]
MGSRRLDISSLLCTDHISDPVILAPHLKQPSQSSSSQFLRQAASSPASPPSPRSAQMLHARPRHGPSPPANPYPAVPKSFGLEALVQVATEERRRLSGSSPESEHHYLPSPVLSQAMPSPTQAMPSPVQLIRSPIYSSAPRHRTQADDAPPALTAEDIPYRSPRSAYYSPPRHDNRAQQLELDRQRIHHEQLLRQEQAYRQATYTDRPVLSPSQPIRPPSILESPQPRPHSHSSGRKSDPGQPRHLLHPDVVPLSAPPFVQDADSVSRKRRRTYSDTPSQVEEQDRIQRERQKMVTGDLGYGRPEPIANSRPRQPESSPVQGRKHLGLVELMTPNNESYRAQPAVAEALRPEAQTKSVPTEAPIRSPETVAVREGGLNPSTLQDGGSGPSDASPHMVSPHRRRSPPGSQLGRALAAKKTEEVELSLHDLLSQTTEPPEKEKKSLQEREKTKKELPEKDTVEKEDVVIAETETKRRSQSRTASTVADPAPPKKQRVAPAQTVSVPKVAEEDAHEWFLEHFDDYNEPGQSHPLSPREHSPPARPPPGSRHSSKARTPTPSAVPDAADALEQELEELLPQAGKVEPDTDMDVDLVTELVAETLDADNAKAEDVGMEVDVEDELLSLLDDQPTPRRTTTKSVKGSSSNVRPPALLGERHASPSVMSSPILAPSPSTHVPPPGRSVSACPASERESMPPPPSVAPVRGKEEKVLERPSSTSGAKSKAIVSAGTASAKPRARPGPKSKPKISDASLSAAAAKSKAAAGNKKHNTSRSRSTSVMPNGSMGPEGGEAKAEKQEEEEESDQEDDKLYCVCKTTYDEDRFMIACDRCDEWYHTQCVNMPDLEVDLVDQFICPPCIEKHPHLDLKTTYKTRCAYGLGHCDPSSPDACHRPARGAFSKYCSDECGVKCMKPRVDAWVKKGGKKEKLWDVVKDAEKREGVVVCAVEPNGIKLEDDKGDGDQKGKPKKGKTEREVARLNGLLDSVVKLREDVKKEMEFVVWREKLLELATMRAEQTDECGWDRRLCFADDQCADLGAGVFESYDLQDGDEGVSTGDWWCSGKKVCDRHAGWQAVRVKDVCKEKEKKNDALYNLTTREREIRKRIEDLLEPHGRDCNDASGKSPLTVSNTKLPNGHTKGKINGDTTTKKGKKRKAPS